MSEFYNDSYRSDGLRSICKKCTAEYKKQWYQDNKEERLEYSAKYYQYHINERHQYYHNNKEKKAEYKKQRYRTLEGFCVMKYNGHITKDVNRGFFTRETIPTNYITPEILMELYQQPDYYDDKLYDFTLMSVDRIDNDKPHTLDNIVVCTWEHNIDRYHKRMTVEEYKEYIKNGD